ncbi:MAG: hypothetical protein JWO92_54 [Chitinophagaceae bacterium]|nr:hypothetical protein [Chitinophagaceae bacterium]
MKNFLTSLIFSAGCFLANAQQNRFIYLQTENKQPFFVRFDNKVLNSYPLGYLIIPKLDDGLYSLVIGFPEVSYEQEFNCSVKNKDVGFIIKNAGEKQWQLFNVQTESVIVPGDVISKPVITYEKETDPFSTMLANAVHDSTILWKDASKKVFTENATEQNKKDTIIAIVSNSDVAISKPDSTLMSDSGKKDIAKEVIPEKPSELNQKDTAQTVISNSDVATLKPDTLMSDSGKKDIAKEVIPEKINELNQKDTTQTVISNTDVAVTKFKKKKSKKSNGALQDSTLGQKEITTIVVPEKVSENKDTLQSINSNNDVALLKSVIKRKLKKNSKEGIEMVYIDDNGDSRDTIRILIPSDKKKNKDELTITEPVVTVPAEPNDKPKENKADYKISEGEKEIIKEANKKPVFISEMINSDCKNFATDDDFLKIRKKMVAENNDEDMIKAARKFFKTKCFTTEQIKNLSVLFLKDEGKYMFFDTAYPFASDSDLYATLEKQLTDNYYITRFRAMIHK